MKAQMNIIKSQRETIDLLPWQSFTLYLGGLKIINSLVGADFSDALNTLAAGEKESVGA
jgi:hypothetical protein